MRSTVPAALAATALLVLAGCTVPGGGAEPDDDPSVDEPVGETSCVEGDWYLDLADYTTQSEAYLLGLGLPLEHLDIAGQQKLTFTADGYLNIATDLTTSAVVLGQAISTTTQSAGGADWYWDATNDTEGDITLENWAWTVEPGGATDPAAPPAAPFFDPESDAPIAVSCSATTLSLQGAGAPLTGNFTR
jgi:hypothetical protein